MTRTLHGVSGKYTDDQDHKTDTNNSLKYNTKTLLLYPPFTMADSTTQDNNSPRKIVTKDDAMVNINALSDLSMVTSEMTFSVNHLKEFILDQITDGPKKKLF